MQHVVLCTGDAADDVSSNLKPFCVDLFGDHHILDNFKQRTILDNTLLLEGIIVSIDKPVFKYGCSKCFAFSVAPMR